MMPKANLAGAFSSVTTMSPIHLGSMSFPSYTWNTTILDKINGKTRPPSLPPKSKMGMRSVFALRTASSLILGGWGLVFPFQFCPGQSKWKIQNSPPHPPPKKNQRWENDAFLPFARLYPWLGWGGGGWVFVVPFYSVRDFSPSYMSTGLSQAVRW